MANSNGGKIQFGIGFNVDKSGLKDLEKSLKDLIQASPKDLFGTEAGTEEARKNMSKLKEQILKVQDALKQAYNPKLDTLNIDKFNKALDKSGTNLNQVYQSFSKANAMGTKTFNTLAREVLTTNVKLKQTHSILDSMGTTMINTIKWSAASTIMNTFTGSIQNAYNYVKALDGSLTDIRIVTGYSKDQMNQFADSANKAAQALGRQTKEYTNAALTFYQQGLSDEEVQVRTETTLKAANITGAEASSVADQLTAVWNGFQVSLEDTEDIVSKMAAVADSSASNMSELATAMSRVASVANNMGVDVDQLNAQIATIIATTRQAPQTVGNALKTIYARINDIKTGTDEAEMSLGNYTGKMAELGVNVLDSNGRLRDTGDVMEQIGERWSTMTREQQIYLTQTMAGQRQMNNLMALFEHWDMYTKELNVSLQAQGTLDQKNAIAMESLAAHTRQLEAASEGLIQTFVNGDSFIGFIDAGTKALQILTDFIDTIGGGGNALLTLGGIATQVFSKQIGKEINNLVTNFQNFVFNKQQMDQLRQNVNDVANINNIKDSEIVTGMINRQQEVQKYYSIMSSEQKNFYNQLVKTEAKVKQQRVDIENNAKAAQNFAQKLLGTSQNLKLLGKDSLSGDQLGQIKVKIGEIETSIRNANDAANNFEANLNFNKDGTVSAAAQTYKDLYESVRQYFTEVKNDSAAGEAFVNQLKQIGQERGAYAVLLKVKEEISGTSQEVQNLNHILDQGQAEWEQVAAKERLATDQLDEFGQKLKQSFNIQGITQLVGALAQVAGSIEAVSSIAATWGDNQQDLADKLGSTIKVLPIAIMGFASLGKALQSISLLSGPVGWAITAVVTAVGIATAAVHGYNQQLEENRQKLIEKNKKDIEELKTKEEEIQTNKKLISNYQDVFDKYKQGKASKEELQAATEALNGIVDQELIRVANLTGQYDGLNKAINNISLEKINQQLSIGAQQAADAYGLIQGALAGLNGEEHGLSTNNVSNGTIYKGLTGEQGTGKGAFKKGTQFFGFEQLDPVSVDIVKDLIKNSPMSDYLTWSDNVILGIEDTTAKGYAEFYEALEKTLSNLALNDDEYYSNTTSAIYQYLDNLRNALKEPVEAFKDSQKIMAEADFSKIARDYSNQIKNVSGYKEYKNLREELTNKLRESLDDRGIVYNQLDLDNYVNDYIDKYSNSFTQGLEDIYTIEEKALQNLGEGRREVFEGYFDTLNDDELRTVLSNYTLFDQDTLLPQVEKIVSDARIKLKQNTRIASEDLISLLGETLLNTDNGSLSDSQIKQINELADSEVGLSENIKTAIALITDENTSYKEKLELIQKLREEQIELNKATLEDYQNKDYVQERTNELQAELDKINQQIEAIKEVYKQAGFSEQFFQQAQSNSQLFALRDQIQKALDNVTNEKNPYQAVIKNLKIRIEQQEVQSDIQTTLENLNLGQKLADALGDGLIVSAEQMKTIVDLGFNQLLEGAAVAYDDEGTFLGFQLDAKLIQQAKILEALKAEADKSIQSIQAEKEKTQQELNNVQKELRDLQNQDFIPLTDEAILEREQKKTNLQQQKERLIKYNAQLDVNEAQVIQESEKLTQAFKQAIEGKSEEAAEEFLLPYQEQLDELKESLLKGSELTDEQKKLLQEVIALVPSLQKQVDVLLNDALKGTKEYEQALVDVEEAFEKIKISKAFENEQAIGENVLNFDVTGPLDEFEEELRKLVEADYQTTVLIKADIDSDFDRAVDQVEQINSAASKIGEDFVVAAEDIRQLNNVFPGILQGMESLGDGSIKLSEQVVRATTEGSRQEAEAALRSAIERMQAEKAVLEAKRDAAQDILDQMIAVAEDETLTEEEKQNAILDLQKKAANLIEDTANDVALSQATIADNTVTALDAANAEGANNFASVTNSAIDNSAEGARIISNNFAGAVKNGLKGEEFLGVNNSHVSSTYKSGGSSGAAVNAFNKSTLVTDSGTGTVTTDKGDIQGAIQGVRDYINNLNNQINDWEGGIAEAQARIDGLGERISKIGQGSGSGKKSGGGGGGGKDKSKSADQIQDMKLKNEQIDLYHELDRAIKATQETLDDYDKAKKKTVRNGLAQTIDNQIEALEKQKGLYEQKIGMMQAQLQAQQANLAALGVQFDEQGNIINYTGLMIEYQNLYNSLLEEAKFLTGDAQEGKLRQAEAVKAKLDALRSQMGAYEALQDKITEAGNAIEDILDKEEELRIQKFKINIDVQLEFAEAERDWNEFRKKVIDQIKDDNYVGQATARLADYDSYYKPDGGGIIQELTEHVNRTREEAEIIQNGGTSQIYGRNEAQALEDLKHYTDELMQSLEDVEQIAKDIHDLYLDTIDKAQDAFDEQIDQYEQIAKIIEHDINLTQLLNPNKNQEVLVNYYNRLAENNKQQIEFYRMQVDMWKQMMDAAEQGTEEWKKFRDNWQSALNDMNDAIEASIENLMDKYRAQLKQISNQIRDKLFGGNYDIFQEQWDTTQWKMDFSYDDLTKASKIQDYIYEVQKSINKLNDPKKQKELNDYMQARVKFMQQQQHLTESEYNLELKRLEIILAEQALQESKQNATSMRLRRDSQGNYTYQFVANQDDVLEKEQNLLRLQEQAYHISLEVLPQLINSFDEMIGEDLEKLAELGQKYGYQSEEFLEFQTFLKEKYYGQDGIIPTILQEYEGWQDNLIIDASALFASQLESNKETFLKTLGKDPSDEDSMLNGVYQLIGEGGQIPSLLEQFKDGAAADHFSALEEGIRNLLGQVFNPMWENAIQKLIEQFEEAEGKYDLTTSEISRLTQNLIENQMQGLIDITKEYQNDLSELEDAAKVNFEMITKGGIDPTINETAVLIQANGFLIGTYQQEIETAAQVAAQIANLTNEYERAKQAAIEAADAAMKFWMAALGYGVDLSSPDTTSGNAHASSPGAKTSSNNSGGSGGGGTKSMTVTVSDSGGGGGGIGPRWNLDATYATGGYTGEWTNGSTDGRVAVLHQKQLVLNEDDTSNILSAVDIVRGLANKVAGINDSLLSDLTGNIFNSQNINNSTSQNIVINADFPGVSDALEIKNAFDNLMNIASQYANGNRRTY